VEPWSTDGWTRKAPLASSDRGSWPSALTGHDCLLWPREETSAARSRRSHPRADRAPTGRPRLPGDKHRFQPRLESACLRQRQRRSVAMGRTRPARLRAPRWRPARYTRSPTAPTEAPSPWPAAEESRGGKPVPGSRSSKSATASTPISRSAQTMTCSPPALWPPLAGPGLLCRVQP
jgi:hypothetical protein